MYKREESISQKSHSLQETEHLDPKEDSILISPLRKNLAELQVIKEGSQLSLNSIKKQSGASINLTAKSIHF